MHHYPLSRWLATAVVPLLGAVLLGWMLLGFAGRREGMVPLPHQDMARLSYMVGAGRGLTLTEVKALPEEEWRDWGPGTYVSKREDPVLWVRAAIRNTGDAPLHGVLQNDDYFANRVEVWTEDRATPMLGGEAVAPGDQALVGREVAFPVEVPPRSETVIFLKFEDPTGPYARLLWWPNSPDFHLACQRGALAEGLYFGGLLALLGYNVLLWVRLRQPDIRQYVMYLCCGAIFMFLARAQTATFGWKIGTPDLERLLSVSMALSGFFLTRFARIFLELGSSLPAADPWLKRWSTVMITMAGVVLCLPGRYSGAGMAAAVASTGLTHAGLVVLVAIVWKTGFRQARFFMMAFGFLFAGSLLMVAVWFLDTTMRDAGMRGLMIGSALEMLMLSLAVSDRFARTREKLVEETEQRRMIEEAYADELEDEVTERTRELRQANADKDRILSVIGHDLRGPLTGLMRSAEETGRDLRKDVTVTSRTLLLMIEDLVLWSRLRAGGRAPAIHRLGALVQPAVALHHSLASHDGVELQLDIAEDVLIRTDLVLAQTLVRNLLANALKFARTTVVIRTVRIPGGIRVLVGNDGPPLSPAVAARLASGEDEPMTATGGMGLKLCREICHALEMQLESDLPPEGGTEFGFTLKTHDD